MPTLTTRQPAPTPVQEAMPLPPKIPQLPGDVLERFPSLIEWQEDENAWWTKAQQALQTQSRSISQNVTQNRDSTNNLRIEFGQFVVTVSEEIDTIITEQEAIARRIVTVSAQAGVSSNISVQGTPPVGPAISDFWIDNSDITTPITYQWDGASWVEVTDPIAVAGVFDERTARVTADGFLEGKYTLTVVAGDVITGFNITSASGPGTSVSNVAWTADQFQIYSGTAKKIMFVADGPQNKVRMAGVFTVDGATTSIYIKTTAGAGSYNSAGTPFFVDATGRMSLGTGLVFDGTNLTVSGTITATAGSIGGWDINPSTLSKNNAILDSAGQLVLGTANDVVYLSATDGTYRIWIGNATAGSATFRVTKAGALFSTSGTIGGFTISSTTLSATDSGDTVTLQSTAGGVLRFTSTGSMLTDFAIEGMTVMNTGGNFAVILRSDAGSATYGDLAIYDGAGNITIRALGNTGAVTAVSFAGSGASLTSLPAGQLTGTIDNARLPGAISVTSLTASGLIRGATGRFGNFTAIGAEVLVGWIDFTDAGGTARKLGVIA